VMNTGRQMYHWHTGTMTRRSTGLDAREPVPVVDINPRDALELGINEGETVRVTSRRGSMLIGARLSERQARGQIFIPFHFREAAANLLTNPRLDPYAKIAEFKISSVKVEPAREAGLAEVTVVADGKGDGFGPESSGSGMQRAVPSKRPTRTGRVRGPSKGRKSEASGGKNLPYQAPALDPSLFSALAAFSALVYSPGLISELSCALW
jgi:formylmethanofuran dehydrogenase subunit D